MRSNLNAIASPPIYAGSDLLECVRNDLLKVFAIFTVLIIFYPFAFAVYFLLYTVIKIIIDQENSWCTVIVRRD